MTRYGRRLLHDLVTLHFARTLMRDRQYTACEVGLPRARADIVRLDRGGEWLEIYEVKVRNAEVGIPQLQRYANLCDNIRVLRTLVVLPEMHTDELAALCDATDTRLVAFDGCFQPQLNYLHDPADRYWVHLPFHCHDTLEVAA